MGDAANSDSGSEQLPHMNEGLFPRAAASPSCLSSRQETAAGDLQISPVFTVTSTFKFIWKKKFSHLFTA